MPSTRSSGGQPAADGPRRPGPAGQALRWFLAGLVGVLTVALAIGGVAWVTTPIPDANRDFSTANTHLYYADGRTELGTLSVQNREVIAYDEMPQAAKDAIVAAENPTFWTDPGISVAGIARALTTITDGANAQGGSTITQQYVKLLYLNSDRTLTRKLKELVIALKLGQSVDKQEILAGYLNTVYYGRGAYGLQAAARAYFAKDARDLTLPESVLLVSVVNSPGKLDPALGDTAARNLLERYQYVLNRMVETGVLTDAQRRPIYAALPALPAITKDPRFGGTDGYLMKMVIDELKDAGIDDATINGGGLRIVTTFDAAKQAAAVQAAQAKVREAAASSGRPADQLHASVVAIDNATGGVLALYGGNDDYVTRSRNWATTPRPTGSTFKTWALVAALRQGVRLDHHLKGYTFTAADGKPVSGETDGLVSLREATTDSINAAYVDLVTQLTDGPAAAIRAATDAGLSQGAGWEPTIRLPMGTAEVAPVDNAAAYATLAGDGVRRGWHVVSRVTDRANTTVYQAPSDAVQAIEPEIAKTATDALKDVATSGTGKVVGSLGRPVAGKTGTRWDGRHTTSSWFVGSTKQITTAVNFVAGDTGQEPLDPYSDGFYGSGYPARTWLAFMTTAMQGLPELPLGHADASPATDRASLPPATVPRTTPVPARTPTVRTSAQPSGVRTPTPRPSAHPTRTARPTATATPSAPATRATAVPSRRTPSVPITQPTATATPVPR